MFIMEILYVQWRRIVDFYPLLVPSFWGFSITHRPPMRPANPVKGVDVNLVVNSYNA